MLSLHIVALLVMPVLALAGSVKYEKTPVLDAADMLGAETVKGEHYRIQPKVLNDGKYNTYTITSQSQTIIAKTNLLALERAHEFEAIAALQNMKESAAYKKGLDAAIDAPLTLTKSVIEDPLGTLEKLPEGINNLLNDLGAEVSDIGRDNAQQEENAMMKDLIGFNTVKRRLSAELKVDPYSSNPLLQQELNDVAWAMFAGGAPIDMAMMAAPVVVGIAVRSIDKLGGGQLDWKIPPATLRQAMDVQVQALGLTKAESEKVVYHAYCSLRHQSILVSAMVDLAGVEGRDALLRASQFASDELTCRRNQSLAEMLWSYHHNISRLSSINLRDGNVWLLDENKHQLLVSTADYLVWTEDAMQLLAQSTTSDAGIFIAGTVSSGTRQALVDRQFTLHERVYLRYPQYLQVAAILLPERTAQQPDGQENTTGNVIDDVTSGVGKFIGDVFSGLGLGNNSPAPDASQQRQPQDDE